MNRSILLPSVFALLLPLGCGDGKPDPHDRSASPDPMDEAREDLGEAADKTGDEELADEADDAVLATLVKAALAREFHDSDVLVSAEDGTITLSGTVPTLDQRLKATALAKGVGGVEYVNNELYVVPDEDE